MELWACWCFKPQAKSTREGSSFGEAQAEAVETATPNSFKRLTIASPSTPSKRRFILFGRRFFGWPFK